ncbi:MAG: ribosomal protein large subunit ribosomal protein [Candidatus Parcubacteria bacterium]|jgi:large subunit ribosomal protein L15
MQLHHLTGKKQRTKRVGRGGKRGTTSGRGQKGQKSRSGHRIRPAERDLLIRIPKLRGFRNKPRSEKAILIELGRLAEKLHARAGKGKLTVTLDVLREAGLVPRRYLGSVKILSGGEITYPIALHNIAISSAAKEKIEKAGGNVGI